MPRFDLELDQLRTYRPDVRCPQDFDEFWDRTLAEARAAAVAPRVEKVEALTPHIDIYDVRFSGFGGEQVGAWYLRPAGVTGDLPGLVHFAGYGGGRGIAYDRIKWPAAGFATLMVDTRGQGSLWSSPGVTPDPHGSGPSAPGFMTRGIESADSYYYRRVFTDAARAVEVFAEFDGVDASRIAVQGGSQGGGMALAAGALAGRGGLGASAAAVLADVPFLCHFERAVGFTGAEPYEEISRYLGVHRDRQDEVFDVLSYFDGVNMAERITVPTRISVGLLDDICPPSTVFAAANRVAGAVVDVYHHNGHDGGDTEQWQRQVRWLREELGWA